MGHQILDSPSGHPATGAAKLPSAAAARPRQWPEMASKCSARPGSTHLILTQEAATRSEQGKIPSIVALRSTSTLKGSMALVERTELRCSRGKQATISGSPWSTSTDLETAGLGRSRTGATVAWSSHRGGGQPLDAAEWGPSLAAGARAPALARVTLSPATRRALRLAPADHAALSATTRSLASTKTRSLLVLIRTSGCPGALRFESPPLATGHAARRSAFAHVWSRRESNPRPLPCQGSALPLRHGPRDQTEIKTPRAKCALRLSSRIPAGFHTGLVPLPIMSIGYLVKATWPSASCRS